MKKAYDVELKRPDGTSAGVTDRTTFVIAPSGKIVLTYSDMKPNGHIEQSLAAVKKLRKS